MMRWSAASLVRFHLTIKFLSIKPADSRFFDCRLWVYLSVRVPVLGALLFCGLCSYSILTRHPSFSFYPVLQFSSLHAAVHSVMCFALVRSFVTHVVGGRGSSVPVLQNCSLSWVTTNLVPLFASRFSSSSYVFDHSASVFRQSVDRCRRFSFTFFVRTGT